MAITELNSRERLDTRPRQEQKSRADAVPFPYPAIAMLNDHIASTSFNTDVSSDGFASASETGFGLPITQPDGSTTSDDNSPWTSTPPSGFSSSTAVNLDTTSEHTDGSEPSNKPVRSPGLIRRISQGAHNRLRKRSVTQANRFRDQTAGPVIVRRPSDLTGIANVDEKLAELDLGPCSENEDEIEYLSSSIVSLESANMLGLSPLSVPAESTVSVPFENGIAPTISTILEQGTWVLKVTKKSRKPVKLRLDSSAAKVCWQTSKKDTKSTPKPSSRKQFFIDDIREVRLGPEARNSRQDIQISDDEGERWMTVIYTLYKRANAREIKTMHFIAPNHYILKLWIEALKQVERERIEIMNALSTDHDKSVRSMQLAWSQIMAKRELEIECRLTLDDAQSMCRKLEINCESQTIKHHFESIDIEHRGSLDYTQYEQFINLFKIRDDVRQVYDSATASGETTLGLAQFLDFIRNVQMVNVDENLSYWQDKFYSIARKHNNAGLVDDLAQHMTVQAFQKFLMSGANTCMAPAELSATLDLPLNEYFISSSHNTYLLGRQIAGDSTVEGYINALARGCRCVEVDCWDGKAGRPVVNHGRTLTSEVLFEDCIHVINKYAFASSPYPLIVSLEVHCCPEQQAVMVDIMTRIFGTAMVTEPINESMVLPSPEGLRNRILIKVKSQQPHDQPSSAVSRQSQSLSNVLGQRSSAPVSPLMQTPAITAPPSPILSPLKTWREDMFDLDSNGSISDSEPPTPIETIVDMPKKTKTSKITPDLAALGVYVCGMKYSDFASPGAKMYNHIYSLAENAYGALCKEETRRALEMHNSEYLMRVYPARMRLDSSNFNPLQSWRHGVQMAALNWQTNDINLQINHAMFDAGTDRTGYVLKPLDMRTLQAPAQVPGYLSREGKGIKFVKFSVDIISAQRLPRPRSYAPEAGMNPSIQIEIISPEAQARGIIRADESDMSCAISANGALCTSTKTVDGNGFNPRFDAKIMASIETKYPELVFVRFTVWSSSEGKPNDTMVATFTAKLDSLRGGYRHLPLYNAYGERYREAKLFIRLQKDGPISLNADEIAYYSRSATDLTSPKMDKDSGSKSWPRKMFSRTSSLRGKRTAGEVSRGSSTRQSSVERCPQTAV